MHDKNHGLIRRLFETLLIAFPCVAVAGNGLYTTGYGAISSTMSGADLAVARGTSAFVTNPAGILQIGDGRWDFYSTTFDTLGLSHADQYGNDEHTSPRYGEIAGGGYAKRLPNRNLVAGFGLNVQGGLGNDYKNLNTAFGTRDEISGIFAIIKLSPGLAWHVNERLNLGASIGITYARAREKFFPNTSVSNTAQPSDSFFGIRVDGLSGVGVGARVGLQYQLTAHIKLAALYASPTNLYLSGGNAEVNYEALNQGRVRYQNAKLDGLQLPHEAGLAIAWLPRKDVLLTLQTHWFNWDASINSLRLRATKPNGPAPTDSIDNASALDLKNQFVFSIGTQWMLNDRLALRAGYAYGKDPQPDRTLSPIFALIEDNDVSFGFGYQLSPKWELNGGTEVQLRHSVTYTNPQFPFGDDAREINDALYLHLMISRTW